LQAELAFAVASLPVTSVLPAAGLSYYLHYCRFIEGLQEYRPEATPEHAIGIIAKSEDEYLAKQSDLVVRVLWKTQNLTDKALRAGKLKTLHRWKIAPEVFEEYRKIREVIGHDTEVQDPRDHPEMWNFLDRIVREKFPDSCTPNTADASDNESRIAADNDITPDDLAREGDSRVGAQTADNAAPANDDPAVVGTTRPTTTTIAEPTNIPDADIPSRQASGSDRMDGVAGRPAHSKVAETADAKKTKRKKVSSSQGNKGRPKAGTEQTAQPTTLIEEEDDNEEESPRKLARPAFKSKTPGTSTTTRAFDDYEGGEAEEDEDEEQWEEPPKKRAKSAPKPKASQGHSASRALNDPWDDEERQIFVDVSEEWINKYGIVDWNVNFSKVLEEVCDRINAYRAQNPKYAGRPPRKVDSVRSQVTKKEAIIAWRAKAVELQERLSNREVVSPDELKPKNFISVADIKPKKKNKG
jgi:hypothetical protein